MTPPVVLATFPNSNPPVTLSFTWSNNDLLTFISTVGPSILAILSRNTMSVSGGVLPFVMTTSPSSFAFVPLPPLNTPSSKIVYDVNNSITFCFVIVSSSNTTNDASVNTLLSISTNDVSEYDMSPYVLFAISVVPVRSNVTLAPVPSLSVIAL